MHLCPVHLYPVAPSLAQHYVCFCLSGGQWILFDDTSRRHVGRSFDDVKDTCVAGRLHPMLLFFEARA